jgi:hypothetical protein
MYAVESQLGSIETRTLSAATKVYFLGRLLSSGEA